MQGPEDIQVKDERSDEFGVDGTVDGKVGPCGEQNTKYKSQIFHCFVSTPCVVATKNKNRNRNSKI